jgi:hypothetical protein
MVNGIVPTPYRVQELKRGQQKLQERSPARPPAGNRQKTDNKAPSATGDHIDERA